MQNTATRSRAPEARTPTRQCSKKGCGKHTREGKPYCSDHIEESAHPRRLMDILAKVEAELLRVGAEGPRAVDIRGLVVEEILAGLTQVGSLTWRRLCKNHVNFLNRQPPEVIDHYLARLKGSGLVTVRQNKRNSRVVTLTPKGLRFAKKGDR